MSEIKQLFGVSSVEVNKEKGKLFIEDADGSGIEVDINGTELMHLLDKFTDESYTPEDIYGIKPLGNEWEDEGDHSG